MTRKRKKLILVVHGIGEQSAGETLDQLAGAASGNSPARVESEVRWLRDDHDGADPRAVELFPCHVRKVSSPKSETVYSEVYWADLSRGREGAIATAIELIKGILGLGHVVRENAYTFYPAKHPLKWMSSVVIAALHGPIAVLNLLLAVGVAAAWFTYLIFGMDVTRSNSFAGGVVAFIGFASAAVWFWTRNQRESYLFGIFAKWLFAVGAILVAIVLLMEYGGLLKILEDLSNKPRFSAYKFEPALTGFNLYAFFLIILLQLSWLFTLCVASILIVGEVALGIMRRSKEILPLYPVVAAIMVFLWILVGSCFWAAVGYGAPENLIHQDLLTEGIKLIFVIFVLTILIAVVATAVWFGRQYWAENHTPRNYKNDPVPRLLINESIKWTVSLAIILLTAVAIMFAYAASVDPDFISNEMVRWLTLGVRVSLGIGAMFGAAYMNLRTHVSAALGIGKDVITYFKGEPVDGSWRYPLRKRINSRFNTVTDTLLAAEKPDEVIVVAHSQGTVIAIEALRASSKSKIFGASIKSRKLVTMGSPYTHIYEHYFPTQFRLPSRSELGSKFQEWLNIFRIDDFVGTVVGKQSGSWPRNIAVNAKGHTGYWTDDEVLRILNSQVIKI